MQPHLSDSTQHIVATLTDLGWHIELDTFTADTPLGKKSFTNIGNE